MFQRPLRLLHLLPHHRQNFVQHQQILPPPHCLHLQDLSRMDHRYPHLRGYSDLFLIQSIVVLMKHLRACEVYSFRQVHSVPLHGPRPRLHQSQSLHFHFRCIHQHLQDRNLIFTLVFPQYKRNPSIYLSELGPQDPLFAQLRFLTSEI